MKLYPAIDLRGGQAVRLYQGDYDQMTVYNADPAAQAREFIAAGAKYLHVVDLDGAKDDTTANMTTIAAIAKQGGLFIEVGGGIRDEARIEQYLSLGVGRCILGTIAVKDFDFTARMAQKYGPKIAVGVDMRDGLVAVNGWKEVTPEPGVAFCRRCAEAGVQAIIATDISRDGTMQGTNMDLYRELLQISGLEITASGGIARMEELAELQAMQDEVLQVRVPDQVNELMDDVLCGLRGKGIHISDRKYFNYAPIAQAKAWLSGRDTVEPSDLTTLCAYLWTAPEERTIIQSTLERMCNDPLKDRLDTILAEAVEGYQEFTDTADAPAARRIGKLRDEFMSLYITLSQMLSNAQSDAEREKINACLEELERYSKEAHASVQYSYVPLRELYDLKAS